MGNMKSELVVIRRNDVFTNTYIIAQNVGYPHRNITKHIDKYKVRFNAMGGTFYTPGVISQGGRPIQPIDLNEQQAIFLMTLLDNTERVLDFKMELAQSFVTMRRLLLERQTVEWQETRQLGKQIRLRETDAIKALVEYAKVQGSKNADKLYMVYTKLVKSLTSQDARDNADVGILTEILVFEKTLFGIITDEMTRNTPYKKIFQNAKSQLMELKRLWAMPKLSA